ncbi:protein TONSOKU isoform X2 [Magnolia sinica]|uniref:protein TONSOKU isoform X2 n=1 Tax=Magnolia sinica TaxID=86752 RepID=UPI00265A2B60|nr:protein TONSOKU isoform X2 [Magnolia sinica]
MTRDDLQLKSAKISYKEASFNGNRQEEARWANVIGDILKQRGEYIEALRWLRIDYEISIKHLPEKHLLPTCQSLGEVYLRLQRFEEALIYQKKHLELAKDADDLVEQQRACTQLGRTYHEICSRSDNDHFAVRNAKKYFKTAMELARTLKENPLPHKSSLFVKEFIDAHNNLGMLEMDLDNLEEAQKFLLKGLKICDEEEMNEDDDARSRLHHNLGSLYIELRAWDKAKEHIERDILICKRIGHPQGEAKGYINLGELHYQVQKYDEAILCYQKALDIVGSMEDEDALVDQINQNIETVQKAAEVLEELKKEEQKLKKLARTTAVARGTGDERRCLLQQNTCLDCLIDKSSMIFAWTKHREFAKRKKRVTTELCDKEKLGDSFLAIGESYQKLRKFDKAHKWYMKSWNAYESIGNLEGQALSKINIGDVLDSAGDWAGALEAFKEGHRIAAQGNLLSVQISALENMHYSHMIRFDNVEEASSTKINASPRRSNPLPIVEEFTDDLPLISLIRQSKNSSKKKRSPFHGDKISSPCKVTKPSSKDIDDPQPIGRKRVRVVLSDDESDINDEMDHSSRRFQKRPKATSNKVKEKDELRGLASEFQDVTYANAPKDVPIPRDCTSIHPEESSCSFKPESPKFRTENLMEFKSLSAGGIANASNSVASRSKSDGGHVSDNLLQSQNGAGYNMHTSKDEYGDNVTFKIGDDLIHMDACSCVSGDKVSIEYLKVEVARLYYLQLCELKRSKGVLPIIQHLKFDGKALESVEPIKAICGKGWIEVAIDGWVQKRLLKLYIDNCKKLSEAPNMKLLLKLYNLEVSEDEVIVSDCELQDMSISPFLNALEEHGAFSVLDVSHNLLGNKTMEKLRQIFASSSHKYRGLTLDLHCNRLGPVALSQICECPELFAGLEVLNLSRNRLTDSCGSYLSTILENCKALYSLNIEECSITSRTVQKIADALDVCSVLTELCLGKNNPITGNAICNLLAKLATLKRFSELNLNGVKLSKTTIDSLCELARSTSLSGLMLGHTNIGADGLVRLTEALSSGPHELEKLDLSCCGLSSHGFTRTCENIATIGGILELNLGGNSIGPEGSDVLVSFLMNPECCLKVLVLNKCHLGLAGMLQIVGALAENESLEELNLAENADLDIADMLLPYDATAHEGPESSQPNHYTSNMSTVIPAPDQIETEPHGLCVLNSEINGVEVPDSEDESTRNEPTLSNSNDTSARLSRRNRVVECRSIQELSKAIGIAKQLQLLDLSSNGFPKEAVEMLYASWSASSRSNGSIRHVEEKMVHFSVEGKRCCGAKICCKRY